MTFPDNGQRPLIGNNVGGKNIRMGRIQSNAEPSIEQAVNITHLLEVNQLLRSENNSLQQNNHLLRLMLTEK